MRTSTRRHKQDYSRSRECSSGGRQTNSGLPWSGVNCLARSRSTPLEPAEMEQRHQAPTWRIQGLSQAFGSACGDARAIEHHSIDRECSPRRLLWVNPSSVGTGRHLLLGNRRRQEAEHNLRAGADAIGVALDQAHFLDRVQVTGDGLRLLVGIKGRQFWCQPRDSHPRRRFFRWQSQYQLATATFRRRRGTREELIDGLAPGGVVIDLAHLAELHF